MIKYKLTNQQMQTYRNFQWELGVKRAISSPSTAMCSEGVFHYYASPEQAVLFNPIHADIREPRLFEVEVDKEVAFNGLKGGCHEMTLVRELSLPKITTEQRVTFAIKVALKVYSDPGFVSWAERWLSGEDRSEKSAREAATAATAARAARAEAAARMAAREAATAARAEAAEAAAWMAARAARAAARAVVQLDRIDFQEIIQEVLK